MLCGQSDECSDGLDKVFALCIAQRKMQVCENPKTLYLPLRKTTKLVFIGEKFKRKKMPVH